MCRARLAGAAGERGLGRSSLARPCFLSLSEINSYVEVFAAGKVDRPSPNGDFRYWSLLFSRIVVRIHESNPERAYEAELEDRFLIPRPGTMNVTDREYKSRSRL
jgi:hypothetical protein